MLIVRNILLLIFYSVHSCDSIQSKKICTAILIGKCFCDGKFFLFVGSYGSFQTHVQKRQIAIYGNISWYLITYTILCDGCAKYTFDNLGCELSSVRIVMVCDFLYPWWSNWTKVFYTDLFLPLS